MVNVWEHIPIYEQVLDRSWWKSPEQRKLEKRIRRKIWTQFKEQLQYVKNFWEGGTTIPSWDVWYFISYCFYNFYWSIPPLWENSCLKCQQPRCYAWIAITCGGCGKINWRAQKRVGGVLWCRQCSRRRGEQLLWNRCLKQWLGVPRESSTQEALNSFESVDQLMLGLIRWRLEVDIINFQWHANSKIETIRCQQDVPLSANKVIPVTLLGINETLDAEIADLECDQL